LLLRHLTRVQDVGQDIHKATLFPHPMGRGCVVADSAGKRFFPGRVSGIQTDGTTKRKESEELKRQAKEIKAACALGDSSLIVLRQIKSSLVLFEYPIHGSGGATEIRKGREVARLQLRTKTAGGLTIAAFQHQNGGEATFVVVASNGSIEMAWPNGEGRLYDMWT
jgi:hypothetical protein